MFHCIYEEVLGAESFWGPDATGSVKCVFQIWERQTTERKLKKRSNKHKHFTFVPKSSKHSIAVRTHGSSVGEIRFPPKGDEAEATWRFIEPTSGWAAQTVYDTLIQCPIAETALATTTKQPSIGKAEIVELYDKILNSGKKV